MSTPTATFQKSETVDLDTFLTQIESKLRGPFSSLDLTKAVSACVLSGANVASQYLSNILEVLPRAEKVTQLRTLIGLLGLEPADDHNYAIEQILEAAQVAPFYEEWVRIIAGLVQGILFEEMIVRDEESIVESPESASPVEKNEVNQLLDKTCAEIIDRVQKLDRMTSIVDEETEHLLTQSDVDPLFAPYRYNLLSPSLLQSVLPESVSHCHFLINQTAEILNVDSKLEMEKAKEEQEHQLTGCISDKSVSSFATKKSTCFVEPNGSSSPDFERRKQPASRPKSSSMFIPSKPPPGGMRSVVGATGQLKPAVKPLLHQRKAGAAQSILAKGRRGRMMGLGGTAKASETAVNSPPPAPSLSVRRTAVTSLPSSRGVQKSKMKMIDVTEVQGLESKKQQDVAAAPLAQKGRKSQILSGKKRSNPTSSSDVVADKNSRLKKTDASRTPAGKPDRVSPSGNELPVISPKENAAVVVAPLHVATGAGELASAALLAYQSQKAPVNPAPVPATTETHRDGTAHKTKQQDWRQLLQQRSNRLSDKDRSRIQQFFVDRFNPTPEQSTCKIKLHEERTVDAKTGKSLKETYYLELDYENSTSTQTKKVKRYEDG
jgi:hypothetical protein